MIDTTSIANNLQRELNFANNDALSKGMQKIMNKINNIIQKSQKINKKAFPTPNTADIFKSAKICATKYGNTVLQTEFDLLKKDVETFINDYEGLVVYSNTITEIFSVYAKKKQALQDKIDKFNTIVNVNNRKTYYEDNETQRIYSINYILLIVFWICFISYAFTRLYQRGEYNNYKVWLLLIFIGLIPNVFFNIIFSIFGTIYAFIKKMWDTAPKDVFMDIRNN
jgi:hypothetical protein